VPITGTGAVRFVPSEGDAIVATGASVTLGLTTKIVVLAVPTLPAASLADASRTTGPAVLKVSVATPLVPKVPGSRVTFVPLAVSVRPVTPTLSVAETRTVRLWPMLTCWIGSVWMMTVGAWVSGTTLSVYGCGDTRPPALVTSIVIGCGPMSAMSVSQVMRPRLSIVMPAGAPTPAVGARL